MPIYIYHSIDYGITFEVFHPFSKGNEPLLANFSTTTKEVHITTPIEFSNYSIGEVLEYQWDFENDGIIDSFEEMPIHIFQDTGYYSVKLSIVGSDSTNTFLREDYIHIIDTTTKVKDSFFKEISVFPNPVDNQLFIRLNNNDSNYKISIYSLQGEKVKESDVRQNKSLVLNFANFPPGIYIMNIKNQNRSINYKIIKN